MAKYDSMRKLERSRLVLNCYQTHPSWSLRQVGWAFNLSPQRVWVIIKAEEKSLGHKLVRGQSDA